MFEGMTSDEILVFIFLWAVFSAFVAMIANARGRNQLGWFAISFLLSPLIGFIAVVLMPNLKDTAPAAPLPPCPRCQTPRIKGQRHCPGCGLDLWADYDAKRSSLRS